MSYDLAVWEGDLPKSDEEAAEVLERITEWAESNPDTPPTPRIRAYIEALLEEWPDLEDDEDSPWSVSPLIAEAVGHFVYFPMVYSRAEEVSQVASDLASEHGLVCFDPQLEELRP